MTDVAFLAEQINFLHSEYETHQREAVTDAIAAGEALIEAKQHVGHGNWIDWVNTRLGFTERTARRYMQIARNRSRVSDMNNIREALGELAEPADDPKPEPPVTHQSYQVRLLERGEYGERHGSLEADNSPVEIHDLPAPMDETDEARHALINAPTRRSASRAVQLVRTLESTVPLLRTLRGASRTARDGRRRTAAVTVVSAPNRPGPGRTTQTAAASPHARPWGAGGGQ
jgi:hypothetical protein